MQLWLEYISLHDLGFNEAFYCTHFCLTPNNHFKHISPSLFPCRPDLFLTRSCSRVTKHVSHTSTHGHLALLISGSSWHLSLAYILLSTQTAGGRAKRKKKRDFIISHPGQWCEVKHVAHTSTPPGHCQCTDTGVGGLGRPF